jgi:hypothetical protein
MVSSSSRSIPRLICPAGREAHQLTTVDGHRHGRSVREDPLGIWKRWPEHLCDGQPTVACEVRYGVQGKGSKRIRRRSSGDRPESGEEIPRVELRWCTPLIHTPLASGGKDKAGAYRYHQDPTSVSSFPEVGHGIGPVYLKQRGRAHMQENNRALVRLLRRNLQVLQSSGRSHFDDSQSSEWVSVGACRRCRLGRGAGLDILGLIEMLGILPRISVGSRVCGCGREYG